MRRPHSIVHICISTALLLACAAPVFAVEPLIPPSNHPTFDDVMDFLTDTSSPVSAAAFTAGMLVLGRETEFTAAQEIAAAVIVSAGVTGGLKLIVNRQRPEGETTRNNSSFPSGHATGSFAIATVLAHHYPHLAPLAWLWAGSVSYSRLYKHRHYPTDVVAGALIGITTARLAMRYSDRYTIRGRGVLGIIMRDHGAAVSLSVRF